MASKEIMTTYIRWRFKCLKCGYCFQEIAPKIMWEENVKCLSCGSTEFKKTKVVEYDEFVGG